MPPKHHHRPFFAFFLFLLLYPDSHLLVAQNSPAKKPRSAFARHFRCQQTVVRKPSPQQFADMFDRQPVNSYRIAPKAVKRGKTRVNYPVFKAISQQHKPFEKQINALIRTCFEEECNQTDFSDSPHGLEQFWYEVVVQNESFLSIHLTGRTCSNHCHYYSTSLNYDLKAHKRLSNCGLLARLGVSDQQFEKAMRARWSNLYVGEIEGQYPSFQKVKHLAEKRALYEGDKLNRYNASFDEVLKKASMLPVVYKNRRYLRLGFFISGPSQDLVGFTDWALPVQQ